MKKTFALIEKNKKPDRTLDSIKNEIRKYFKRERTKKLPEDAIFWELDCRFGKEETTAQTLQANDIIKALDQTRTEEWTTCYIEILSRPSEKRKVKKTDEESSTEED